MKRILTAMSAWLEEHIPMQTLWSITTYILTLAVTATLVYLAITDVKQVVSLAFAMYRFAVGVTMVFLADTYILTPRIKTNEELSKGNVAVAITYAAIVYLATVCVGAI